MLLVTIVLIWWLFYVPIHDRMPWSYKRYIQRKGITVKRGRKNWE